MAIGVAEVTANQGEIFLAGWLVAVPEGSELSEVGWQGALRYAGDHDVLHQPTAVSTAGAAT